MSRRPVVIVVGVVALSAVVKVSISAYQTSTTRHQVSAGLASGNEARAALVEARAANYDEPFNEINMRLDYAARDNEFVGGVHIDQGKIVVTYETGAAVNGPIRSRRVVLAPQGDDPVPESWRCSSPDIENKFLPEGCRSD